MPRLDPGKEFERAFQGALDELKEQQRLVYARLYDTRSARGFIPPQPADFIGVANSRAFLIECKASEEHDTLATCLSTVDRSQAASLGLWARHGCLSLVFFFAVLASKIEVWDGDQVSAARARNKPLFEPRLMGPASGLVRVVEKALLS